MLDKSELDSESDSEPSFEPCGGGGGGIEAIISFIPVENSSLDKVPSPSVSKVANVSSAFTESAFGPLLRKSANSVASIEPSSLESAFEKSSSSLGGGGGPFLSVF